VAVPLEKMLAGYFADSIGPLVPFPYRILRVSCKEIREPEGISVSLCDCFVECRD
jgi:hypothetical protein